MLRAIPSAKDELMFQVDMHGLISKINMKTNLKFFIFYMTGEK
jgi:hypothetical protein